MKLLGNFNMYGMIEVKEKTNVLTGLLGMIAGLEQVRPNIVPTYKPTEIDYNGKKYVLREPLDCKVTLGTGSTTYRINYDPLLIWGAGYTMDEAIEIFNLQFADTYDTFNEDGEGKLCNVYQDILRLINKLVISVENYGSK
jgi:hypothetical protein